MALPQLQLQGTQRTVREVISWMTVADYRLDVNPPYQRGPVWTEAQRVALMKSLLMGLPIGALYINHRDKRNYTGRPRLVDGQQRLRALEAFTADAFAIPADWADDRDDRDEHPALPAEHTAPEVRFSGLTKRGQRMVEQRTVTVLESELPTEAQEAELYLLINWAGTDQSAADRERATRVAGG